MKSRNRHIKKQAIERDTEVPYLDLALSKLDKSDQRGSFGVMHRTFPECQTSTAMFHPRVSTMHKRWKAQFVEKHFVCCARTAKCCDDDRELLFFRTKWIRRGHGGSVCKIGRQYEWACKHVILKCKSTREARPTVCKVRHSDANARVPFGASLRIHGHIMSKYPMRPWKPIVARTAPPKLSRRLKKNILAKAKRKWTRCAGRISCVFARFQNGPVWPLFWWTTSTTVALCFGVVACVSACTARVTAHSRNVGHTPIQIPQSRHQLMCRPLTFAAPDEHCETRRACKLCHSWHPSLLSERPVSSWYCQTPSSSCFAECELRNGEG